jgi:hypothetical protein
MKPNPFLLSNHLILPLAIMLLICTAAGKQKGATLVQPSPKSVFKTAHAFFIHQQSKKVEWLSQAKLTVNPWCPSGKGRIWNKLG